jgi:nucleoside-diphosphate-sugar epimerase
MVITGASGFVGRVLAAHIAQPFDALSLGAADWEARLARTPLAGATVLHLAGRVHSPGDGEAAFQADNAGKTRALAESAARQGARRVVYLSTIKIYGEQSPGRPLAEDDPPKPEDAYARSKLAAEQALTEVARTSGLEAVIVRSPLVYGPGVRANLAAFLRLVDSPWPLPFATLAAPRSFVHVDDLARLLLACAELPQARGRTYIGAHPTGVTTAHLATLMRRALGRAPRLWPMPAAVLEGCAALVGQGAKAQRLTRSLIGDPSAAQRELGWTAAVPIEQAVEEVVRDYSARQRQ